jgi:hypothetical protein
VLASAGAGGVQLAQLQQLALVWWAAAGVAVCMHGTAAWAVGADSAWRAALAGPVGGIGGCPHQWAALPRRTSAVASARPFLWRALWLAAPLSVCCDAARCKECVLCCTGAFAGDFNS